HHDLGSAEGMRDLRWLAADQQRNNDRIISAANRNAVLTLQTSLGGANGTEAIGNADEIRNALLTVFADPTLTAAARAAYQNRIDTRIGLMGEGQGRYRTALRNKNLDNYNVIDIYCASYYVMDFFEDGNSVDHRLHAQLILHGSDEDLLIIPFQSYLSYFAATFIDFNFTVNNAETDARVNGEGENSLKRELAH
ncbi:6117_t:CDS:1, partial [Funneliformis caledonium]